MTIKEKMQIFIKSKKEQIQRGREVTEQMRAEKLRKKNDWITNMKPGALRSIAVGMKSKASPMDVMKEEYERRKYEREHRSDP